MLGHQRLLQLLATPFTGSLDAVLQLLSRHPVLTYFALAYLISWSLWLPAVAAAQGWWQVNVPTWWHYTGASGPLSAAILVTALSKGRPGLRSLLAQYSPSRVRRPWLAFAVVSPLVLVAIGLVLIRLIEGEWPTYADLARADNLPAMALPLTLLVHISTFGIGEETGWRGFVLTRLQHDHTAMRATHLLALGWGLWHLPAFFENESFMAMGPLETIGWAIGIWMGAIFLTWLYNSSHGSLLIVVFWHGLFNQFSASAASSVVPATLSVGVIVTAIVVIRLAGVRELTGPSEHVGSRQRHSPT